MIIKVFQLHKREASVFDKIEDKYAVKSESNVYALADGASQKLRSGLWAKRLVEAFVGKPAFELDAFKQTILALAEEFDNAEVEYSVNPAMKAIEKKKVNDGASSTFLGMSLDGQENGKLIACGDSNFFHFRKGKLIDYFPYNDWEGIRNNNAFLNTKRIQEKGYDDTIIKTKSFKFLDDDLLVLASDALSSLIFKDQNVIDELWAIKNFDSLRNFCEQHWDNKTMTEDDISAIIVKVSDKRDTEKILPPEGFAFPKPIAPVMNYIPNQTENMKEVMQQIHRTGSELKSLFRENEQNGAKANRLILLLLGAGILLTLVNGVFLFTNIGNHASKQEVSQIDKKIDTLNSRLAAFQLNMERHYDSPLKNDAVTNTSSTKNKTDTLPQEEVKQQTEKIKK